MSECMLYIYLVELKAGSFGAYEQRKYDVLSVNYSEHRKWFYFPLTFSLLSI